MLVFRIAKTAYIRDLSGMGARLYGGRWNHKGIAVLYSSETRSLATVEYLVHVPLAYVPDDLSIATLTIPDDIDREDIPLSALPRNWRSFPPPSELAELGTSWVLSNRSLTLRVPSTVVEHEYNVLINPAHPDFSRVVLAEVEKYTFDKRLLRLEM